MQDFKRSTQQLLRSVQTADANTPFDRLLVPTIAIIGLGVSAFYFLRGDLMLTGFFALTTLVMVLIAASQRAQTLLLGRRFNRRHVTHFFLFWIYGIALISVLRMLLPAEFGGKGGSYSVGLLAITVGLIIMLARTLLIFTKRGYKFFSTGIPIWEQILLAINETVALLLLSGYTSTHILHALQPDVFTTRENTAYAVGLGLGVLLYYLGTQFMWIQRMNDWLSLNHVWVLLARLLAPFALVLVTLVIASRLVARTDPRTANLAGGENTALAVLAIAPVIWLIVFVVLILVYTGRRGLRQRFMPDALLEWLPNRLSNFLKTISDMDMMLIALALVTTVPTYLLVIGGASSTVIGFLRAQIFQSLGTIVETNEQALALLFATPFYILIVGMLALYGFAISQTGMSAKERDELVSRLPIGFLIILIITLYLFALPFSQVFTEGRLPNISAELGRILAFNVLIPLVMLYAHYFILIRMPYGRGQRRWRDNEAERLNIQLHAVDRRLDDLNRQIQQLDRIWHEGRAGQGNFNLTQNFDTLYRYLQLNGLRDDMNMQRLQVLNERQELAEISEAPVALAVARLPIRVVSLGIPLLLAIQIYQWAVVNNGLRAIIENPNLTVFDFFRAILKQTQF
ncbi:MAG: hypothetical protein U0670_10330 [Anaerolineae bacterium]